MCFIEELETEVDIEEEGGKRWAKKEREEDGLERAEMAYQAEEQYGQKRQGRMVKVNVGRKRG